MTFDHVDLGKATFGAVLTWLIGITSGFHLSSFVYGLISSVSA
jgi:hypothetical protein